MSAHTSKPWKFFPSIEYDGDALVDCGGYVIAHCGLTPDDCVGFAQNIRASRIVACVNALAGIPDPAAFVAAARELRDAIRCNDHYESTPRCDGRTATKLVYGKCDACDASAKFDAAMGDAK